MKAAVCYEFGKPLIIEAVEIDPPQAEEVRVKLAACAICHSDIYYIDGAWGGSRPAVYGHEASGVIEEIGAGVTRIKPGDRVVVSLIRSCGYCFFCVRGEPYLCETTFALDEEHRLHNQAGQGLHQGVRTGAFAEFVVVHQSQVVRLPDDVPLDSASLLACGVITGLGAVTNTAQVPAGSSVVVIGTGGVGLNSVQGAVLCGAYPIIAVDLNSDKLVAATSFGATHTINPAEQDAPAAIKSMTHGRGADYVIVTVGSARAIEQAVGLLRKAGTAVIVGMPPAGAMSQIEGAEFAGDSQHIMGSKMGSTRLQVDVPNLVDLYRQHRLKLDELITARYPLEEINDAIAAVKRGEALRNVIVF